MEIVERHVMDPSRLFTWIQRNVNDDITGFCYERNNTCLPAWCADTAVGANPTGHTSGGVFQTLSRSISKPTDQLADQPVPIVWSRGLAAATVTLRYPRTPVLPERSKPIEHPIASCAYPAVAHEAVTTGIQRRPASRSVARCALSPTHRDARRRCKASPRSVRVQCRRINPEDFTPFLY